MEYFFHYAIPSPHDMGQECDTQKNRDHVKRPGKQGKQVFVLLGAVFLFEVFQQLLVQQGVGVGGGGWLLVPEFLLLKST